MKVPHLNRGKKAQERGEWMKPFDAYLYMDPVWDELVYWDDERTRSHLLNIIQV